MKILSFQPFSLFANGGGNRILRRLYEGREDQVISLAVEGAKAAPRTGKIEETTVLASPLLSPWMRWKLRNLVMWLRDNSFKVFTIRKIQKAAGKMVYDVIHVVHHGPFVAALCSDKYLSGKQLWVSFHDHFSTTHSSFAESKLLWNRADRRLVISEELGIEYKKLFGDHPFEIITDGVKDEEISLPAKKNKQLVNIYFAGLLHIAYVPLFQVLADTLDAMAAQGYQFKLLLRGTQQIEFLGNRQFEVEYRPVSLNDAELKAELDAAAILYLPIKFTLPDFYLYSLSTKMVGYLGAPGAILYHGPGDSAACNLLTRSAAAASCASLNASNLEVAIKTLLDNSAELSANAKKLAGSQFNMANIQAHFWQQRPELKYENDEADTCSA